VSVPAWLLEIFAAVMLLVAAVSAARLALAWRAGRRADPDADIDVSHLLMGLAMAGTLVASLSTLPAAAWEVIFGALTLWFAYRVAREYRGGRGLRVLVSEHHAPHLLHSAAMLYMFLALRTAASGHPASGMPSMGGQSLRLPTLALAFAFLLCAYVVADLDRVPAPPALARLHLAAPAPSMALAGVPSPGLPAPPTPPAAASRPAPATTPAASRPAPATTPAAASPPAPPTTPAASPPAPPTTPAPEPPAATPASLAPATPVLSGLLSPGVARGCRIAMGVTMAFMLIIMI
jgi:Domain of unknown function (DUF5134)